MTAVAARPIRAPEDTRRAVQALQRRSQTVRFWRRALPIAIGAGLVILFVWAGVRTFIDLQPQGRTAGDIRMIGPEFHGRSKDGRPYVVTAQSADRDPDHPERSTLIQPRLVMETATHGQMRARAQTGVYDETAKVVTLFGGVVVDDDKGEHFDSPSARVDTAAHVATGDRGVRMSSATGAQDAQTYSIDDKAGYVVLQGRVHTRLQPHAVRR